MVITFCGHSQFRGTQEHQKQILNILEKTLGNNSADMYLGGYGGFDEFAYSCCKEFKKTHPNISLIFVTPYITPEYQKNHLIRINSLYDSIVYPQIEDKPKRFAITYRNRYMIDAADFVVANIDYAYGGAYKTFTYAIKKNKRIYNLGKLESKL